MTIEEEVRAIQEEIDKTQKNKATEHHLGRLKAKMARLKDDLIKQAMSKGGGAGGYSVKKSGDATVTLVGFPSVGKSTLINKLTDAHSEVGAYEFTTLDVIPGVMEYNDAKIQVLDLPGLVKGAAAGRGKGREVISVIRACDLILLLNRRVQLPAAARAGERAVRRGHPHQPAAARRDHHQDRQGRSHGVFDGRPQHRPRDDQDHPGRVQDPQRAGQHPGGRELRPDHRRGAGQPGLHTGAHGDQQDRPGRPESHGAHARAPSRSRPTWT